MSCSTRSILHEAALTLALICPGVAFAEEPSPPKTEARKAAEAIRPLPPVAIPDDPPPHEGAMIDLPYTIEPPDILVVEVLVALPGRPITGERLVRPDGTISLGFYGDVHVRGLTIRQAKVKIINRLREYLGDEVLGLVEFREDAGAVPNQGGSVPHSGPGKPSDGEPKPEKPAGLPEKSPSTEAKPEGQAEATPGRAARRSSSTSTRRDRATRRRVRVAKAIQDP